MIFILVNINDSKACETKEPINNNRATITDLVYKFLTENYSCDIFDRYVDLKNCTTIGNFKCRACKLVKIMLKLRKFPSNLTCLGVEIQELMTSNETQIFENIVLRFRGFDAEKRLDNCVSFISFGNTLG